MSNENESNESKVDALMQAAEQRAELAGHLFDKKQAIAGLQADVRSLVEALRAERQEKRDIVRVLDTTTSERERFRRQLLADAAEKAFAEVSS